MWSCVWCCQIVFGGCTTDFFLSNQTWIKPTIWWLVYPGIRGDKQSFLRVDSTVSKHLSCFIVCEKRWKVKWNKEKITKLHKEPVCGNDFDCTDLYPHTVIVCNVVVFCCLVSKWKENKCFVCWSIVLRIRSCGQHHYRWRPTKVWPAFVS